MTEFMTNHMYDVIAMISCISFLAFITHNRLTSRRVMRYFFLAALSIIVVILAENIETALARLDHPTKVRVLSSAIAYCARPASVFFIILIPLRHKAHKYTHLLSIPLILDAIISFSALFCPLAFSYTGANHFTRGPLGLTPFIVSAFYLFMLLLFSFEKARRGERQESVICIIITIVCAFCAFVESEFVMIGFLSLASIIGEIFYYMFFQIERYCRDALTGLYTRSQFYRDIEGRNDPQYFILFDVNGLKKINDNAGHIEGDKALCAFADAAGDCVPKNARAYRFGGDEFAILYKTDREENITNLLDKIRKDSGKLPFGFSAGYAQFSGDKDFDAAYSRADEMLYVKKKEFWSSYQEKNRH